MFSFLMRGFVVAGSLALVLGSGASAQAPAVDKSGATACAFPARSEDRDPAGQNVRRAPRADAPVIGRLPAMRKNQSVGDQFVELRVKGWKDGWFLIDNAEFEDYGDGKPSVAFRGEGWIAGGYLKFDAEDAPIRAAPSDKGALVDRAKIGETKSEYLVVTRALACKGAWVEIEGEMHDVDTGKTLRKLRGWVTKVCANQATTCS